jgi:4-diphosphocytidyl-2-C-methyl-D-erythritol kinase
MPERTVDPVSALISAAASKVESARAKINLALHILDRRADGYHLLDSLVVFAELADTLAVFGDYHGFIDLAVDGPFAEDLRATTAPDDNLVLAVARGLAEVYPDRSTGGVRLHLSKQLPVAAGLGGGSADAAAALRLLNRLWRLDLNHQQLAHLGLSLGADVPVCLLSRPARVQGVGEAVTPLSGIPAMTVVLVNPGIAVSTSRVFRRLERTERQPLPPIPKPAGSLMEFVFWLRKTRNDLFAPASMETPAIEKAVRALAADPDCVFARMSGSGGTVFGIFMSNESANRAAARLHAVEPRWWVAVTRTDGS